MTESVGTLLTQTVMVAAALSSLALATLALTTPVRRLVQWGFGVGMVAFAAESLVSLVLVTMTESPEDRLLWLRVSQIVGLILPLPWLAFAGGLVYPHVAEFAKHPRLTLLLTVGLAVAGASTVWLLPIFEVADFAGRFYAARLEPSGRGVIIFQLMATVAILASLETTLRASTGVIRWRIKYLILGLGGAFLVRFYLLSNVLLFHVMMGSYLTTGAAVQCLANLLITASLTRDRLVSAEMAISRRMVYRSVVVGILGVYLFVIGGLGWLANRYAIPETVFWSTLVVFASAVALAIFLLSEDMRWRLKRFVAFHFYRDKYDYRDQWINFTKRVDSLLTVEELVAPLLSAVTSAVGTARAALYLADDADAHYHLVASLEVSTPEPVLPREAPLLARLRTDREPLLLERNGPGMGTDDGLRAFAAGGVAVPLLWRGTLMGVMLVGPERTGDAYISEDLEFLATAGQQAAGALATARLSERAAQAREFEAFHRLTSFVVHDIKNSIASLSMLSQNAVKHLDDPEFQRDAIRTVSRTVDRMRGLMARLSSAPDQAHLRFETVDLNGVIAEATPAIASRAGVALVTELGPIPTVLGDSEALLRVIQNLLKNAVEACDGKGTIAVITAVEDGTVTLTVRDTGCGMSDDFLRKSLFAPFRSTKKGGWGIGLYQTKSIIEGHHGSIEASSALGAGTTFRVRLPLPAERGGREDR